MLSTFCEETAENVLENTKHMPLHRASDGPRKSFRGSFCCRRAAAVCFCIFCGVFSAVSSQNDALKKPVLRPALLIYLTATVFPAFALVKNFLYFFTYVLLADAFDDTLTLTVFTFELFSDDLTLFFVSSLVLTSITVTFL